MTTRTLGLAALAALAGVLLYGAHPPFDVGWLAPIAIAVLAAVGRRAPGWRAGASYGMIAGLVFFGLLLSWILRFGVVPLVLLVSIQATSLAIYLGIVAAWRGRTGQLFVAVIWWVALEAARSAWPFGGFAWGVLGYSQHQDALLPLARVIGVLGLSAVVAALGVALEAAVTAVTTRDRLLRALLATGGLVVLVAVSVVVAPAPPRVTGRTLDIAAVQGNDIELPSEIDRLNRVRIDQVVERMVTATAVLEDDPPDVAVWPENSLDADFRSDPALAAQVERALSALDGGTLLAGALLDGPTESQILNVIIQLNPDGDIVDRHIKRRLVPFGEYVPLRSLFDWYSPLEQIARDQISGDEPTVFDVAGARIAPVNCYESIFPGLLHDQVRAGANIIALSTNNASFGRTPASDQHLAFTQVRAVEAGRWIMHAGISGVSAIVSPTGDTTQRTELFEQAIVRGELPLIDELTLATRFAHLVGPTAVALAALSLIVLVTSHHSRREDRGKIESERTLEASSR